jgi:hypothetical protein
VHFLPSRLARLRRHGHGDLTYPGEAGRAGPATATGSPARPLPRSVPVTAEALRGALLPQLTAAGWTGQAGGTLRRGDVEVFLGEGRIYVDQIVEGERIEYLFAEVSSVEQATAHLRAAGVLPLAVTR